MRRRETHDKELFTALTYNIFILESDICASVDVDSKHKGQMTYVLAHVQNIHIYVEKAFFLKKKKQMSQNEFALQGQQSHFFFLKEGSLFGIGSRFLSFKVRSYSCFSPPMFCDAFPQQ